MRSAFTSIVVILGVIVFAGNLEAEEINIVVAPKVLNLDSKGTVVTVHTDIAYSAVIGASVTLEGISIKFWKSDSRGNFVAKFSLDTVKDLVRSRVTKNRDTISLTLSGTTPSNGSFSGTDEVAVIGVTD